MMKSNVFAVGLSHEEVHTLEIMLPISFRIIRCDPCSDFEEEYAIESLVHNSVCIVINPVKLLPGQLKTLLVEYDFASHCCHIPLLLFTQSPTRAQLRAEVSNRKIIHRVNLHSRMDREIRDAVKILRQASMPSWMGLNSIKYNIFNDGWYLLELETTGSDPLRDDITAVHIAYMARYEVFYEECFRIKPPKPISPAMECLTGITNESLKDGISLEQLVEKLVGLEYKAPLLFFDENYTTAFLDVAWHICGKSFEKPYLAMDGLAAIVFGYSLKRKQEELLTVIEGRMLDRVPVSDTHLAELYDLTLAVFEELMNRYDIHCPGQFETLYDSEILE